MTADSEMIKIKTRELDDLEIDELIEFMRNLPGCVWSDETIAHLRNELVALRLADIYLKPHETNAITYAKMKWG